jgi:hypothetical protein
VSQSGEVRMDSGCGCEGPTNCLKPDDKYGQAMGAIRLAMFFGFNVALPSQRNFNIT